MTTPKRHKTFDLEDPEQARDFLQNLYYGDMRVGSVTVTSGREILFEDFSDEEAVSYAKKFYEMQCGEKWGLG